MFARVSTYQGDPTLIDEGMRYTIEHVLPKAQRIAGWKGVYSLVDRESSKALLITLWENEETMRVSEEEANRLRGESAEASDEMIESVERYEVALYEAQGVMGGTLAGSAPKKAGA